MERDELAKVFYGEGAVPAVWATDCPVRFDVWLAFAQPTSPPSDGRTDLILSINEEHGTRWVLDRWSSPDRPQLVGIVNDCQVIASGGFISARMTLEEVFRAVLPMTNLAAVIKLAQDVGVESIRLAFHGQFDAPVMTNEPGQTIERRQEQTRHMVWFIRLIEAVLNGSHTGTPPADPLPPALALLNNATIERGLTRWPENPKKQVIDRRLRYPILSVTTNRPATPAVTRSRTTIKADAAEQVFSVDCSSIGWAVVDSGIDANHPAFRDWWDGPGGVPERGALRIVRAFNFVGARGTLATDALENGLVNWSRALPYVEIGLPETPPGPSMTPPKIEYTSPEDTHGTHVAGIIGGCWPAQEFQGICPTIRLYDFRVLDRQGNGDEFSIVTALQAIRYINEQAGRMVIAGVNLSLSVPHDVATHTCGWTPVCIECDRLTRSGVIVVAAAGNAGYTGVMKTTGVGYHAVSISDPGNTDAVITVGSTHRSDPHRHGVSYFSSRGPTADGRAKPDILAPGEDIDGPVPGEGIAAMHGTSQAAAHVSGAAAMLVARYRELLGRPEKVKSILCQTATDLGRERDFQGNGLVDVLRAMQSV